MPKSPTTYYFIRAASLLLLMGTVFFAVVAHAQPAELVTSDEPSALSAFQTVERIDGLTLAVPTVVALPVALETHSADRFLVYNESTQQFIGSQLISSSKRIDPVTQVETEPFQVMAARLIDNDRSTSVDFPVAETEPTTVMITLQNAASEVLVADRLLLDLAPHVALPLSVVIRASVNGVLQTVVAPRSVNSRVITFPKTTAEYFVVEFTYVQPLRIVEMDLIEEQILFEPSHQLRFLAQPGDSYRVYSDPDRSVSVQTTEPGNLSISEGVLLLAAKDRLDNSVYVPADIDGDGVRDTVDNCVQVANVNQTDVNNNGKGDICEDFDRDGQMNPVDNCPNTPNRAQSDEDGDGIGDACDEEESRLTERYVWVPWVGMGLAVVVIGTLFAVVGVRPREEESVIEADSPDKPEVE